MSRKYNRGIAVPTKYVSKRLINLVGQRFGRLIVTEMLDTNIRGSRMWQCLCDCGTVKISNSHELRNGYTSSCGCLKQEIIRDPATKFVKHGHAKHGNKQSPEYRAYTSAKQRCTNPNIRSYEDYGGRGIQFKFNSFEEFYKEVGPKPGKEYSLDRIRVNGHYEKGNLKWSTLLEQNNNQRPHKSLMKFSDEEIKNEYLRRFDATTSRSVW